MVSEISLDTQVLIPERSKRNTCVIYYLQNIGWWFSGVPQ